MATEKSFSDMTVDELNVVIQALNRERDDLRAEILRIKAIRDQKAADATAKERVATMSDAEKRALFQEIKAQSLA